MAPSGGAGQAVERSPDRAEQRAAGERDHRAGQEQHGGDGVHRHVQHRTERAGFLYPVFECRDIQQIAIDVSKSDRRGECGEQNDANKRLAVHGLPLQLRRLMA